MPLRRYARAPDATTSTAKTAMNPNRKRYLLKRLAEEGRRLPAPNHIGDAQWHAILQNIFKMQRVASAPEDYHDILDVTHCGPLPNKVTTVTTGGKVVSVHHEPRTTTHEPRE